MKVYFIGAGPGDPELLTLKAKRIISEADVVIYAGSLINREILKGAKKGAALFDSAAMTLEEVTRLLLQAQAEGKTVARLHSGDPSLFSATQEQMDWCRENSVPFEVVPGVSSYSAACASLGQELTLPGVSQTVILTRLAGRTPVPEKENLRKLAAARATLVLFLSVNYIDQVVKQLADAYGAGTPVAVVEKASWPEERVVRGTLGDIAGQVKDKGVDRTALIIVGDVLNRSYERSRLYHKEFGHGYRKKA